MAIWRKVLGKVDGWTTWGRTELAEDVEAYLEGNLLERRWHTGAGGQAPAWLWLNAVAHGDPATLEQLAAPVVSRPATLPVTSWRTARAVLAHELLSIARGDAREVRRLQREAVAPLEPRLATLSALTPGVLHGLVMDELWFALT